MPPSADLTFGETQNFDATVRDVAGQEIDHGVVWSLADEGFGSIRAGSGVVIARRIGSSRVLGRAGTVTGEAPISAAPVTFETVSAGSDHTCAIASTGRAYCWGNDRALGRISSTGDPIPVVIFTEQTFSSLDAGDEHTCGVLDGGESVCWGSNSDGQLGRTGPDSRTPVMVSGGRSFERITAGAAHTCGLENSLAYCWGSNLFGELGSGDLSPSDLPVQVVGGHRFSSISAGGVATCGVTLANEGWCWGQARSVGTGSFVNARIPTRIAGGLKWRSISMGSVFACGLTTSGEVYCWGDDRKGALGDGPTRPPPAGVSLAPIAVTGGLEAESISAGLNAACLLTPAGRAYCWGVNAASFGDGSTTDSDAPVLAAAGMTLTSLSIKEHACAIASTGLTYCWGRGARVGAGSSGIFLSPVLVAGQVALP